MINKKKIIFKLNENPSSAPQWNVTIDSSAALESPPPSTEQIRAITQTARHNETCV